MIPPRPPPDRRKRRAIPNLNLERQALGPVAGIDEAGRGPLAGPVVAAAVLLEDAARARLPGGIDDSKVLAADAREALFAELTGGGAVAWAVGLASVDEIDRINILEASMLAMRRAVLALPAAPALALVDGNRLPDLDCAARAVIGGDRLCTSVAAASIVAKVIRDRIMDALARAHPEFGWDSNRGYATAAHRAAIRKVGVTCHHRRSFGTVREVLEAA